MKSNRGFTLIELLVVIAIIGILSSVVLASLNTARSRGEDAKIQGSLGTIRTEAELFYDGDGELSYDDMCDEPTIERARDDADGTCRDSSEPDSDGWIAYAELSTGKYHCIDSSGNVAEVDDEPGGDTCEVEE